MNIRITAIISLFILFFAGTGNVSAQEFISVKVEITLPDEDYTSGEYLNFPYHNIEIYSCLSREYANTALENIRNGRSPQTVENLQPYRPDKEGRSSFTVPRNGAILVWCRVFGYELQRFIISADDLNGVYSIKLNKKPVVDEDELLSEKGMWDYVYNDKGEKIDSSLVTAVATATVKGAVISPKVTTLEGPDGMVRSFRHKISCRVSDYMRVLVQPILYDRSDISNSEADTIYSYGHAIYHNMEEYDLTQLHRMDFDISHDSINYYTRLQGDSLFYDALMADTMRSENEKPHVWVNLSHDTIDVYVIDRFRGYDPDTSHPYPYGVNITIDDYNSEIHSVCFRDNGERRNPLRFLNYSFTKFLPDSQSFEEAQNAVRMEFNGELKLNFESNKAYLVANDTVNIYALRKLEEELRNELSIDKQSLYKMNIKGVASPEGNLVHNLDLAESRAEFAKKQVAAYVPAGKVYTNHEVAGWDTLADSLRNGGYTEVADAVMEICAKYPITGKDDIAGYRRQYERVRALPEYDELILKEYLPKLRTVTYTYTIDKEGLLSADTIIARFRRDNKYRFQRGEYWTLFSNLRGIELENAAKYALETTRNIHDELFKSHCGGYWPYAAAVLACCYIDRDTVDLELLQPYLDLKPIINEDGSIGVRPREVLREEDGAKRVYSYINFPDMAANQLIMALRSEGGCNPNEIAALEALVEWKAAEEPAYDKLLAFSRCLRGKYNGKEPEDIRARDLVASSSDHNYVVMALAMDDPSTSSDDAEWLLKANERFVFLEKSDVTDYMQAVMTLRLEAARSGVRDFEKVKELLANCFVNDIKYLLIASNDDDLIVKQGKEEDVFSAALTKWAEAMDEKNLDETHPYHWFKKAWDEVRAKSPDNGLIEERLNKCFSIDERYITVLNIYMRDNSKGMEKGRVEMLRNIRDRYKLKN